jgi:hypothetical protein
MPWVGFEPTIPAFEQAKTVHALDIADTVIGQLILYISILSSNLYLDLQEISSISF